MSRPSNRAAAHRRGGSIEDRLARLLDATSVAHVVPYLPAATLHQLVRHRGLEACGDLVTAATPAQLRSLLDLDLWRPAQPGRDEQLDVDRFGEWIQVLVDTGDSVAARIVAALDTNLVVAGLSRYVRVLDPGILEPTAQSDDEAVDPHEAMREGDAVGPTDDSIGDRLTCEVGGYIVRARRGDAWNSIVTLLLALDAEHPHDFHAVMQGCRRLSNSRPEVDGLDDLLMAPEQHLHDVALARERRRARQGYATAADARAFLQMARQPTRTRSGASASGPFRVNPIVAAYFRAVDDAPEAAASHASDVHAKATGVPESLEAVVELLSEAGVMPARPRALLDGADLDARVTRLTRVRRLMAYLRDTDEAAYLARTRELAFLANTLLAGCSVQSRSFTPQEASDAAAAICNLGLEYWPARWCGVASPDRSSPLPDDTATARPPDTFPPDSLLIDHDLVTAFEVGWSVLHQDVSLFVAEQLASALSRLHCADRDIRLGLLALRRELVKQRDAGTPWRARDAAEVLAMLDATAWIGVLGLLDECPILPAALTAVLEGRRTTVSPTAFDFISTAAQIGDVRMFMRTLHDVLSC